jgi:DNA-binding NtrC family response regulator
MIPAKILLVEDDPDIAEVQSALLASVGYTIVAVHTARDALTALEQNGSFDILFTDLRLGAENGYWLASNAQPRFPDLIIVLTTGYASSVINEAISQWPLVMKPYNSRTLIRVFDQAMRNKQRKE